MRIITGSRRGKKLSAPAGLDTRPTLERVKQRIFDSIQFEVAGRTVLDLFAGSGQLGLEALSRGAAFCVFNDKDRAAKNVIEKNIAACNFEKNALVTCNLYKDCVTICKERGICFSLVLLDPPYAAGLYGEVLSLLREQDMLSEDVLIVCEYEKNMPPDIPAGFTVCKAKECGTAAFMILEREENA